MPLIRRNLVCFYCGQKSAQKQNGSVRQWKCPNCEAINYLDEHGQIADPPAFDDPTPKPKRFAQPIRRSSDPIFQVPDSTDVFCATCLKNQRHVQQTLAAYLPSPDDPQYARYEAAYPAYKQRLETDYPPVCAICAPRVQQRIRISDYASRTDFLSRSLQRTKSGARTFGGAEQMGWRRMLVAAGGLLWMTSVVTQLLWHAISALSSEPTRLGDSEGLPGLQHCAWSALFSRTTSPACVKTTKPLIDVGLLCAALSLWWNPRLAEKMRRPNAQMQGWSAYLALQIVLLFLRSQSFRLDWQSVGYLSTTSPTTPTFRGIHVFAGVFLCVVSLISYRTVRINDTHRISLKSKMLDLPLPTFPLQGQQPTLPSTSFEQPSNGNAYSQGFPVQNLAPVVPITPPTVATQRHAYIDSSEDEAPPARYHTYDDYNAMDWETTSTVQPQNRWAVQPRAIGYPNQPTNYNNYNNSNNSNNYNNSPTPWQPSPSPFRGTLPAAPIAPAHKLRNPPRNTLFQKASEAKQSSFLGKVMDSSSSGKSKSDPSGSSSSSMGMSTLSLDNEPQGQQRRRQDVQLKQSRWFLESDKVDTGLEVLFEKVFVLGDEPAEVRAAGGAGGTGQGQDVPEHGGGEGRQKKRGRKRRRVVGAMGWITVALVALVVLAGACLGAYRLGRGAEMVVIKRVEEEEEGAGRKPLGERGYGPVVRERGHRPEVRLYKGVTHVYLDDEEEEGGSSY